VNGLTLAVAICFCLADSASSTSWGDLITHRVPSVSVPQNVGNGADIVVDWLASDPTHSGVSHRLDWIGMFKAGDCPQNANVDTVTGPTSYQRGQNTCFIAWQQLADYTKGGRLTFKYPDTRWDAGVYDFRYFLGDSKSGHGLSCRQSHYTASKQECEFEHAAKSSPITVVTPSPGSDHQSLNYGTIPGFEVLGCHPLPSIT